jgi:hypothetical protein
MMSSYEHWINGVYLITAVEEDDPRIEIPITVSKFRRDGRLEG